MALIILFALLATPIIEIAVFVQVGEVIGVWSTMGLVVATTLLGAWLLRHQGFMTLLRVRETLDRGELPVNAILDGFFLVLAGALLLTPGFVTDGIGLLLFVPVMRRMIGALIRGRVEVSRAAGGGPRAGRAGDPTIIEGEYQDVSPEKNKPESGDARADPRLPPS